jgi:hypothetical protein
MFSEFLNRDEFYNQYMQILATRMAIGSMEMEDENVELTSSSRTIEIYNYMKSFITLIESNIDKLTPYDISNVAEMVNKNINFFDKGFRKTQVDVKKAKNFFPPPPKEVIPRMYSLIDSYYNIWSDLPIYEKEARFHIELVRMQPFEDGNKRTSRIITNYNLCKQNKAPVIIDGKETDLYFSFIDDYNVEGFTKFLKEKSFEELQTMMTLYETICGDSYFNEENSIQKIYAKQRKLKEDI